MIIHRRNKMDEDCFVTQIRKRKYGDDKVPKSVMVENTEEKQLRRELILNRILTEVVEFMLPNLPDIQDEKWLAESMHHDAGYYQGSLCMPNEQIDCLLEVMKNLFYAVRQEEDSKEKLAFDPSTIKIEPYVDYGRSAKTTASSNCYVTNFRENNTLIFSHDKRLEPENIDEKQLLKERMLNRMLHHLLKTTLKYLPDLDEEHNFKIDEESLWHDGNILEYDFSRQQSERIMEIVKLCLYNLVEEIKGYEQQNSVSKS